MRGLICLIVACGLGLAGPAGAAGTREIYVWQRQFSGEVATALQRFRTQTEACCVLAAEVTWARERANIVRVPLDYAALIAYGRPVGLALRVGAYAGPFSASDVAAQTLTRLARELLEEARAAGLEPAELQIDFDAAESKLAGYRTWIGALRAVTGKTRLVITALPAWLKHGEFADLARVTDGFILQVHSLEKPSSRTAQIPLCEPERALAWAHEADKIGVPFRVALPTYGYLIASDAEGKFLGIAAEGPRPAWPAETRVTVVRADAIALAGLARRLALTPPTHCTGTIWFRLPAPGDRLNWDAVTLETILRGEAPRADLRLEITWPEPGLAEISIINAGTTTEPPPSRVALHWPETERVIAGDALGGFRLDAQGAAGQAMLIAAGVPPDALVAPGQRLKVAWMRFSHELSIDARVVASLR